MERKLLIARSIQNPIGCRALSEYARGKKNILIITDDNTRFTPLKTILPQVISELRKAGVSDKQIRILIASGTHRVMTDKEILVKFGAQIVSRFKICNHNWNQPSALLKMSSRIGKKNICINRLTRGVDFIIGIGSIVPHATCGFSGGGKIILPGICGRDTVEDMHWKALDFPINKILGVRDNPMRKMIDAVAKNAGLKFIVNTVLDNKNRIVDIVAGDPIEAHRKGVDSAKRAYGCRVPYLADIVVADASPMDIDLRQAIKAVAASDLAVRKGGVIILKARCVEGVSPQFPEFEKYGFRNPEVLKRKVEDGKIKSKMAAYTLIAIGRILKDKARVILVSGGITADTAFKIGFLWAGSQGEAIKKAKEFFAKKPKIIFLKRACEILPVMD